MINRLPNCAYIGISPEQPDSALDSVAFLSVCVHFVRGCRFSEQGSCSVEHESKSLQQYRLFGELVLLFAITNVELLWEPL
jgi:hypothetical protein